MYDGLDEVPAYQHAHILRPPSAILPLSWCNPLTIERLHEAFGALLGEAIDDKSLDIYSQTPVQPPGTQLCAKNITFSNRQDTSQASTAT